MLMLLPETELKISAEQAKKLLLLLHPRDCTQAQTVVQLRGRIEEWA